VGADGQQVSDRRQELVFIGIGVAREAVTSALDACLVTDDEWAAATRDAEAGTTLRRSGADPFKPWPPLAALLSAAGDDSGEGHGHSLDGVGHGHGYGLQDRAIGGDAPPSGVLATAMGLRTVREAFQVPPSNDATSRIRGRPASWWPKMPCLTCGSFWWHGDDWDAECANCGAGAEDYDDDQRPRLHRRGAHAAFTAELAAARAAGRKALALP
jgi:hypothetical protein